MCGTSNGADGGWWSARISGAFRERAGEQKRASLLVTAAAATQFTWQERESKSMRESKWAID